MPILCKVRLQVAWLARGPDLNAIFFLYRLILYYLHVVELLKNAHDFGDYFRDADFLDRPLPANYCNLWLHHSSQLGELENHFLLLFLTLTLVFALLNILVLSFNGILTTHLIVEN